VAVTLSDPALDGDGVVDVDVVAFGVFSYDTTVRFFVWLSLSSAVGIEPDL
jgi:hypothetical protein